MNRIYKYNVGAYGGTTSICGKILKLLTVQNQYNKAVVWALIDDDANIVTYEVVGIGTGWSFDEENFIKEWSYLGTAQFDEGTQVTHYFYHRI